MYFGSISHKDTNSHPLLLNADVPAYTEVAAKTVSCQGTHSNYAILVNRRSSAALGLQLTAGFDLRIAAAGSEISTMPAQAGRM